MADYPIPTQLVVDERLVPAANAQVTVYDLNDTNNTAPLALKDMNGTPIANPITTTANALTPPIMVPVTDVKFVDPSTGLALPVISVEGLRNTAQAAATDAAAAKDSAASSAQAAQDALDAARNATGFMQAAKMPETIISGAITRDANGAATSAPVTWPDGTPGTYTATTLSTAFPGAVDAYQITYGSPATKTYTQPTITRNASGAATNVPAITVS